MMANENVIIISNSSPKIGYFARTTTQGPEYEMVKKYVKHLISKYSKLKSKKAAIFIEPQLDSGYPDLVIIEYHKLPDTEWISVRDTLNTTDFKILFFIQTHSHLIFDEIIEMLGFSRETTLKSLQKLKSSGLIRYNEKSKKINHIKLSLISRINKIIAIEAKIDKWSEAIKQANNNIWFSTESYVLMNKETCSKSIMESCESTGTGVILINGEIKKVLSSDVRAFPVSYASLQFNEWLLKFLRNGEKNDDFRTKV